MSTQHARGPEPGALERNAAGLPPRLREPGESTEDYRIAMGWDKPPAAQHTPGPRWKAWSDANITLEGVAGHVAECSTAERAREIAQCLNAHDDLVAQLQHAVRWFDQITPADVARYRAAIAKATGSAA